MAESEPDHEETGKDTADVEPAPDRVDEQEVESFPASDPHSDWSGPAN
jgi:hypothetical protein